MPSRVQYAGSIIHLLVLAPSLQPETQPQAGVPHEPVNVDTVLPHTEQRGRRPLHLEQQGLRDATTYLKMERVRVMVMVMVTVMVITDGDGDGDH